MAFPTIRAGIDFVTDCSVEVHESYKVISGSAKSKHWLAGCRSRDKVDSSCKFWVRIGWTEETNAITLRKFIPHTCPTETHLGWKVAQSEKYLVRQHYDLVANNRNIAPKLVQDAERLNKGNKVSYQQSRRATKKIVSLIEGDAKVQFQVTLTITNSAIE